MLYKYKNLNVWNILGHIVYPDGANLAIAIISGDNLEELKIWADLNGLQLNEQISKN